MKDLHFSCQEYVFSWLSAYLYIYIYIFVYLGMRVYVHGCAATPLALLDAMADHGASSRLHNVEVIHIHTEGPAIYTKPEYDGNVNGRQLPASISIKH